MSSDLYAFEGPFHTHSSPQLVSNGDANEDLFFSDPYNFPCFTHSPLPLDEVEETPPSSLLDPFSPSFFSYSSSPPSSHLQNLSLHPNSEAQFGNSSVLEVKSEECNMGSATYYNHHLLPRSYSVTLSHSENVSKLMMQRSFSSNSFDGKPSYLYQPSPHYETPSFHPQTQALDSPDNPSFFTPQMRRVCSTGDLQNIQETPTDEANLKVGRYSAEERKEKISKYRAKRSQRNFNKTIKYTCRKTLADSRPRIRGRFARNDDASEISNPKAPFFTSTRDEDENEDDFWIEGVHEEQEDLTVGAEEYVNSYGVPPHHFQYYGL